MLRVFVAASRSICERSSFSGGVTTTLCPARSTFTPIERNISIRRLTSSILGTCSKVVVPRLRRVAARSATAPFFEREVVTSPLSALPPSTTKFRPSCRMLCRVSWATMAFFSPKLGIDLGTTNVLVFVPGKGVVLNEPSVVAVQAKTNKVLAIGSAAKEMIGRTPEDIVAYRPMKDGVIADYRVTEAMLRYFMRRALGWNPFKPTVLRLGASRCHLDRKARRHRSGDEGGSKECVCGQGAHLGGNWCWHPYPRAHGAHGG